MEDEDLIAAGMASHSVDDSLTNLPTDQTEGVRQRVLEGIAEIERGEFTEYKGRTGLRKLASGIKARGRAHLFSRSTGHK